VLAIHAAVETPNLFYYFGRSEYSFFDLCPRETLEQFYRLKDYVDVVVCSETQASVVEFDVVSAEGPFSFGNMPRDANLCQTTCRNPTNDC
jgi:phosphoribosylformylglycinamidine (FGAM) synthase-like amidotransferase family enzyme